MVIDVLLGNQIKNLRQNKRKPFKRSKLVGIFITRLQSLHAASTTWQYRWPLSAIERMRFSSSQIIVRLAITSCWLTIGWFQKSYLFLSSWQVLFCKKPNPQKF